MVLSAVGVEDEGEDQRRERVDPLECDHQLVQRDDQDHERHHDRADVDQEDRVAAGEADASEGVAAEDRGQHRASDHQDGDQQGVGQAPVEALQFGDLAVVLGLERQAVDRLGGPHVCGHGVAGLVGQREDPGSGGTHLHDALSELAGDVDVVELVLLPVDLDGLGVEEAAASLRVAGGRRERGLEVVGRGEHPDVDPLGQHPLLSLDVVQRQLLAVDLGGVLRVGQQARWKAVDVTDRLQRPERHDGEREQHQQPERRQAEVQPDAVDPGAALRPDDGRHGQPSTRSRWRRNCSRVNAKMSTKSTHATADA
jgi:hypothetical protein